MRLRIGLVALMFTFTACSGGDTTPTTADIATTTIAAATTTAATTTTEPPPVGASEDTIFFVRSDDARERFNIFAMSADGGDAAQLTDFDAAWAPSISPDRTSVAFFSTDTGEDYVFTIGYDGDGLTQITDFSSAAPDWHPSGGFLVMNSDSRGEPVDVPDIYGFDLDSEELFVIVDDDDVADFDAHYTPDGRFVIFVSSRFGDNDIFAFEIETSEVTLLVGSTDSEEVPRVSPDGEKILYTRTFADGNSEIFLYDDQVQLTEHQAVDDMADWSPDGTRIVFVSDRSGNFDLWTMDADGSNLTQLTDTPELELFPSWS